MPTSRQDIGSRGHHHQDEVDNGFRDAYRSLADTFRAAAASGGDVPALANALRQWALDDPQRYFPHLRHTHAPDDVTAIASEILSTLLDACAALPPSEDPTPFAAHLDEHRQWAGDHPALPAALHRALTFWTRLHGALSLEIAGHLVGFDPALLYAAEVDDLLATSGRRLRRR